MMKPRSSLLPASLDLYLDLSVLEFTEMIHNVLIQGLPCHVFQYYTFVFLPGCKVLCQAIPVQSDGKVKPLLQVFQPAAPFTLICLMASPWTPAWLDVGLSTATFLTCMSQQFHAWAHMKASNLPSAIRILQVGSHQACILFLLLYVV